MQNKIEHSLVAKFNLLKNSVSLASPLILLLLAISFIGGIIGIFAFSVIFSEYMPLKLEYLSLYFKSIFTFTKTVAFHNKEYNTDKVIAMLESHVTPTIDYLVIFFVAGAFIAAGVALYFINKFSNNNAKKHLQDQYLRGTKVITENQLEILQEQNSINGYKITPIIKIDREEECKMILIVGSVGAGKTVLLKRLLREQMAYPDNSSAKFIIHDLKGDFTKQLYNIDYKGNKISTDYIYNMSDKRSIVFNIFDYMEDITDIKSMVSTIIPRSPSEKEPIWTDSAQGILESILIVCIANNKKTLSEVKKMITWIPEKLLSAFSEVEGTEIGQQYLSASETQVANYMSNFVSKAKFFEAISDKCHANKDSFDLQKWLNQPAQSKLFMINDIKNMELNAPRIAVFIESLIKIVLSQSESRDRRIYLYLDELGNISNRIPALLQGVTLGRSFGLSCIIGLQNISQFDTVYSDKERQTFVNNLSSKIILRSPDFDTAKYLSGIIGEKEVVQTSSGSSIGVESNRDGVSFNKQIKKESSVLPSQLMDLNDLEFFFKQPKQSWTHIQSSFVKESDSLENINESFLKCEDLKIDYKIKPIETIVTPAKADKIAETTNTEPIFG